MMPKNVLFIVSRMPVGGAETFLISILNKINKNIIRPVLFSLGSEHDPMFLKVPEGVPKHVHARKWRFDFSPCSFIQKIITEEKIRTAVCTDYFTFFYLRRAVKKGKLDTRIVVLLHVTKPRHLKEFLQGLIFARMLNGNEEIITTCENQKKYLSRLFFISNRQLSKMIYNGIDTDYWTPLPDLAVRLAWRKKFGIPDDAVVIINVAGFRKEKRHDIMIKALDFLYQISNQSNTFLVFVGGGDKQLEAEAKGMASKLDIKNRIIFAGVQEDLRSMYWMADIFTLGSTSETFSIAALEAMSMGLPCVLTDVGGANEMIDENINGFLVSPGSPHALASGWKKCADNISLFDRDQIRNNVVKRFKLDDCIQQYENFLLTSVE
jgi:glycosyltransferase involved in cell wall biosynthesis